MMSTLQLFLNFFLHLDQQLTVLIATYGNWMYGILFLIIFCETGLVIFPFLPGDSLLFASGALAATTNNALNIHFLFLILVIASITGNTLNYFIGRWIGPKVFHSAQSWFFNKKHLEKTHAFYDRHGGKTIILARFIPIIRTFAPFVAGIGDMSRKQFLFYNVLSAFLWIGTLLYVSYWFGNIPFVKNNFSFVVIGIIVISLLPPAIEIIRQKR